jgi:hypothetical protein
MRSAGIAIWMIRVRTTLPVAMICASSTRAARTRSWSSRARCRSVTVTRSGEHLCHLGNDQAPSWVRSDPARAAGSAGMGRAEQHHGGAGGQEALAFGL